MQKCFRYILKCFETPKGQGQQKAGTSCQAFPASLNTAFSPPSIIRCFIIHPYYSLKENHIMVIFFKPCSQLYAIFFCSLSSSVTLRASSFKFPCRQHWLSAQIWFCALSHTSVSCSYYCSEDYAVLGMNLCPCLKSI